MVRCWWGPSLEEEREECWCERSLGFGWFNPNPKGETKFRGALNLLQAKHLGNITATLK